MCCLMGRNMLYALWELFFDVHSKQVFYKAEGRSSIPSDELNTIRVPFGL